MLQLQTKNMDICRISKLLANYNIKASITNSAITLDGDVSNDLLTQLCSSIDINTVQNFTSQEPLYQPIKTPFIKSEKNIKTEVLEKPKKIESTVMEENENIETTPKHPTLSHLPSKYDLLYSEVKRGEVYLCDFGKPYGSEYGFKKYAIVIQNDEGNLHSPTTIVIVCTTEHLKRLPVHFHCTFSSQNMLDYDLTRVGSAENVIMAEHIQTIDKTRLRKYIGTLTPEFMKVIERKVNISLDLSQDEKIIEKKVYVDKPIPKNTMVDSEPPKERKDVNKVKIQLLSFVDNNELLKISQSSSIDEIKVQRILELFGFDFKKRGVQYLLKAIMVSLKNDYFNLETLSESVSRSECIEKEEIKRLIVARVKEKFAFRKAPTIEFIRLVNNYLVKH